MGFQWRVEEYTTIIKYIIPFALNFSHLPQCLQSLSITERGWVSKINWRVFTLYTGSTVEKCLYINPCSPIYFFSSGISVLSAMLVQNPEIDETRMYYFLGMFKNVIQPPCNPLLEGLVEQEDRWIKLIILYSYSIQSVILQYHSLSFRKRTFEWLWDVVL